jgi:hypothetical protein
MKSRSRQFYRQLRIEPLEDRRVLSATLLGQAVGKHQIIYLDFDGAKINTAAHGLIGSQVVVSGHPDVVELSPIGRFLGDAPDSLGNWGLNSSHEQTVIAAIVDTVQENIAEDLVENAPFPNNFKVTILDSRTTPDLFGQENVTRVVVGGTTDEIGYAPGHVGQAEQPTDFPNNNTEQTAVVLLDSLSADVSAGNPYSLNQIQFHPSHNQVQKKIELVGVGVGNLISHELGHLLGVNHGDHTNQQKTLMDLPPNVNDVVGLVGPYWGDGNEVDIDFGTDDGDDQVARIRQGLVQGAVTYNSPRVVDVRLKGPNVLDAKNGRYSFPVGNGSQLGTVPVGGANTIEIAFTEDVLVDGNELILTGVSGGSTTDYSSSLSYLGFDDITDTASWKYNPTPGLPTDQFELFLPDFAVEDFSGTLLDGDFHNPTARYQLFLPPVHTYSGSTFPSGDGSPGGGFTFYFTILAGDEDHDNDVDGVDLSAITQGFDVLGINDNAFTNDVSPTIAGIELSGGDFDGDGDIDGTDLSAITQNWDPLGEFKYWPIQQQSASSSGTGSESIEFTAISISSREAERGRSISIAEYPNRAQLGRAIARPSIDLLLAVTEGREERSGHATDEAIDEVFAEIAALDPVATAREIGFAVQPEPVAFPFDAVNV